MSSEHTISIATASPAHGTRGTDAPVSVPVGELTSSNGLITGQSGAEPAESAGHIAEALLDADQNLVLVDPVGEFGDLTDHSSVLHVGGDRNCDVQVGPDAVDRVASLALDGSTSIVLDLAAFEAGTADDLLGRLTDALIDARRERRADLLLIVDECHRWLAANGPATRTGENLVALGGRRHDGVGIVGVTDQPADIREDVLTGVDWLLAHRLTWREDVRALEKLLDRQYAEALDSLDEREAFFNAGWEAGVQRISFAEGHSAPKPDRSAAGRERAVDEGSEQADADVNAESPSPDDGLLAGLPEANAPENDGDDVAGLREDLAAIEDRLASLEAKVDAREDVEALADRIADAITEGLRDAPTDDLAARRTAPAESDDEANTNADADEPPQDTDDATADAGAGGFGDVFGMFDDDGASAEPTDTTADAGTADTGDASTDTTGSRPTGPADDGATASTNGAADANGAFGADGVTGSDDTPGTDDRHSTDDRHGTEDTSRSGATAGSGGMSFEPVDFGFDDASHEMDSTVPEDFGPPARHGTSGRTIPRYLRKIVRNLEEMDVTTRRMLAFYIDAGTESPMDAHVSAGGGGDRTRAYAHNRRLRTNGLIEHVGKGEYAPRLREYVVDQAGHSVPEHELDRAVDVIRQTVEAA